MRDGKRINSKIVAVVVICALRALTSAAISRTLVTLALLPFGGKHVECHKKQDDAAGNLEGGLGDVKIANNPGKA